MDYNGIVKLIEIMSNSKLSSLEIEENGISIKMKKQDGKLCTEKSSNDFEKVEVKTDTEFESLKENVLNNENEKIVRSPIVGTFYSSASPDKESFVKVGTKVNKGDTLCIIEAMKLMNEIESEVNGEVVEIMVENEQMVEYGQPIFKLKV